MSGSVPEFEENLEVVHGCGTEAEAQLIVGLFQSAGIPSFLVDENLTTYQVAFASATRGFRIAVPKSRKEEAIQVLIENGYIEPALDEDIPPGASICTDCLHTVLTAGKSCTNCGAPGRWKRVSLFEKVWVVGNDKWSRKYDEPSS